MKGNKAALSHEVRQEMFRCWGLGIPVFLVLGTVIVSVLSQEQALKHGDVPGVDGLSMVHLASLDVIPTPVDFSERHAERVWHED